MADVTTDRGQLILVTGLMVAVAMVALVLLLNTAIYTENLASRGIDQSGREAVDFRTEVVEGVGGLIDEENAANTDDYATLEDRVEAGIGTFDGLAARRYAAAGTAATVDNSTATLEEGRIIRQTDAGRSFENASGTASDWTLATDIEDARSVRFTLDSSNLTSTPAEDADVNGAFAVNLSGGADWRAFIYTNDSTGDIAVATTTGGTPTQVCATPDPVATIDLTRATINGEACPGLVWAEGLSGSYALSFEHGDTANGTYELTLDGSSLTMDTANLNDGTSSTASPFFAPAVYRATVELRFDSPTISYEEPVTIAPGEPP